MKIFASNELMVCYLKLVNDEEAKLITRYWDLIEGGGFDYKFKIVELVEDYKFTSSEALHKFISKYCFIASTAKRHRCKECNSQFVASTRKALKELPDVVSPWRCSKCSENSINLKARELLDHLVSITTSNPKEGVEWSRIQGLSYVNKIALLCLLLEVNPNVGAVLRTRNWEPILTGSASLDGRIIEELVGVGAIHDRSIKFADRSRDIESARLYFFENWSRINDDIFKDYLAWREGFDHAGAEILIPPCFEDVSDYQKALLKDFSQHKVSVRDAESIEDFVIAVRLEQAYMVLKNLIRTYNVHVQMNVPLESLLIELVTNFSLGQVYGVLRGQVSKIAVAFHRNARVSQHVKNNRLQNGLRNFFSDYSKSPKEPASRKLPSYIVESHMEYFTSNYICGESSGWQGASAKNVIAKLLNGGG